MPWPRDHSFLGLCLLLLLTALPRGVSAAPPATPPPASAPLPDYGGRDAPAIPADAGAQTADPALQAGRTLGALVLVLGGVIGLIFLLKRTGYTGGNPAVALLEGALRRPSPQTTSAPLAVTHSQTLPGGGMLHLIAVGERTLLIGATAQGITLLSEWESEGEQEAAVPGSDEARAEDAAFAAYLARAGIPPILSPARAAGERVAGAANRLQDLLARAQSSEAPPR